MNFSQLHERLRIEVLRRIQNRAITVSQLARLSGLAQPHLSNFLRSKRRLSNEALDRLIAALDVKFAELVHAPTASPMNPSEGIPLVSHHVAIFEDRISSSYISERIQLPSATLTQIRRSEGSRRSLRERFVAVIIDADQAAPMEPLLQSNGVVILDRHATLPVQTDSRSIFAVAKAGQLEFGYLALERNLLILRPHTIGFDLEVLAVSPNMAPTDLITGRVCAFIHPFGAPDDKR